MAGHKRPRSSDEELGFQTSAALEVLKVYIGTWYQHQCPCPGAVRAKHGLIGRKHVDVELGNMVNYWHRVASPRCKTPDEYKMWLYTPSWPLCWCELAADGRAELELRVSLWDCRNFRGWVDASKVFIQYTESEDEDDVDSENDAQPLADDTNPQSFATSRLSNLPPFVQSLEVRNCLDLVDGAFQHMSNLKSLNIQECDHSVITDFAFHNLSNLTSLNMMYCMQSTITDSAFQHLSNLKWLGMEMCDQSTITDSAFQHLSALTFLDMGACKQSTITDSAFQHLSNLRWLDMGAFNQSSITDSCFQHLSNLKWLRMDGCQQSSITDSVFQHLSNLTLLNMKRCSQSIITDSAFQHLTNLRSLSMRGCRQSTITDCAFKYLSNLRSLGMRGCGRTKYN